MRTARSLVIAALLTAPLHAAELRFKDAFLAELVRKVPEVLKSYHPETGRFGEGIWIVTEQNVMLPLAVAYATKGEGNRYYRDATLLKVIIKAGDALIGDADARGQWVFRKKDGSTWGNIFMPWTYSRWVRAYALIREDMPPEARQRWAQALTLGYSGISRSELGHVHNIPTHHAMGLYAAGKAFDRPERRRQAAEFMGQVVKQLAEGGYWSENAGPVVNYNFVYVDALGAYYAMSGDATVLPALAKSAEFHRRFTYPGGQSVETVDQRNPFHDGVATGNPGFTVSPVGRAWLHEQWARAGTNKLSADALALFILHGQEGPMTEPPASGPGELSVLTEGGQDRAATLRAGPWFVCLSAYTAPVAKNRWIQDRQNLVSIWHDKVGLILGGGNTHLQPAWSTFTIGDMSLLRHKAGDEQPDFLPKGELFHVPSAARLVREPDPGLDLTYGPRQCRVRIRVKDDRTLEYRVETAGDSKLPTAAHLTLMPRPKQRLQTGKGEKFTLTESPLDVSPDRLGGWIDHASWRLTLPPTASLHWPVLPHNPYRKDGQAELDEGRIEIRIPLAPNRRAQVVTLEVAP